jgi:hypothetical protein
MNVKKTKLITPKPEIPGIDPIRIPSNLPKWAYRITALIIVIGTVLFSMYHAVEPFFIVALLMFMLLYAVVTIKRSK